MNTVSVLVLLSAYTALVLGRGIELETEEFIPYLRPYAVEGDNKWEDCSSTKQYAELKGLSISPENPSKGDTVDIRVSLELKEEVSGGDVIVSVAYANKTIINNSYKLCNLVTDEFQCPIPAGTFTFQPALTIPSYIPSGEWTGKLVVIDQDENELGCVTCTFDL